MWWREYGMDGRAGPREVMGAVMQWQRWATKKQGGSTQNGTCVMPWNPANSYSSVPCRALSRAMT